MRAVLRDLTPPLLWRALRTLWMRSRAFRDKEWEYVPDGWAAAQTDPCIKGWNAQGVRDTYVAKWPAWARHLEGPGPLAFSPVTPLTAREDDPSLHGDWLFHNAVMSYAYALTLAARRKAAIRMLDWGGGMGHYYLLARALVADLEIEYHCKDLPLLAGEGQRLLPHAHFYEDERCLEQTYDFVLASSSLHYSPEWDEVLRGLARATEGYLFVTRLPIVHHAPSYVVVQRPYAYGYDTEYLGWCLNRRQFLCAAEAAGLHLIREFLITGQQVIPRAPEPWECRGYLFTRSPGAGT